MWQAEVRYDRGRSGRRPAASVLGERGRIDGSMGLLDGLAGVAQEEVALCKSDEVQRVTAPGVPGARPERAADAGGVVVGLLVTVGAGQVEEAAAGDTGEFSLVEVGDPVGLFASWPLREGVAGLSRGPLKCGSAVQAA